MNSKQQKDRYVDEREKFSMLYHNHSYALEQLHQLIDKHTSSVKSEVSMYRSIDYIERRPTIIDIEDYKINAIIDDLLTYESELIYLNALQIIDIYKGRIETYFEQNPTINKTFIYPHARKQEKSSSISIYWTRRIVLPGKKLNTQGHRFISKYLKRGKGIRYNTILLTKKETAFVKNLVEDTEDLFAIMRERLLLISKLKKITPVDEWD